MYGKLLNKFKAKVSKELFKKTKHLSFIKQVFLRLKPRNRFYFGLLFPFHIHFTSQRIDGFGIGKVSLYYVWYMRSSSTTGNDLVDGGV